MLAWIERWRAGRSPGHPVLLVVGPESTGTRLFTDVFSRHPAVAGTDSAMRHADLLDPVWQALAAGNRRAAMAALGQLPAEKFVVTRRSLPHGAAPGTPARYLAFPDLEAFVRACRAAGRPVIALVTTRSPAACIASAAAQRASVRGDLLRARRQYEAAYGTIVDLLARTRVPFHFLSVEALVLDGNDYVQGLFRLLGLDAAPVTLPEVRNPNTPRYAEFAAPPPP